MHVEFVTRLLSVQNRRVRVGRPPGLADGVQLVENSFARSRVERDTV